MEFRWLYFELNIFQFLTYFIFIVFLGKKRPFEFHVAWTKKTFFRRYEVQPPLDDHQGVTNIIVAGLTLLKSIFYKVDLIKE